MNNILYSVRIDMRILNVRKSDMKKFILFGFR